MQIKSSVFLITFSWNPWISRYSNVEFLADPLHVSVHELVMGFPIWVKLDFDTVSDKYFWYNDKEIGIIGQGHTSTFWVCNYFFVKLFFLLIIHRYSQSIILHTMDFSCQYLHTLICAVNYNKIFYWWECAYFCTPVFLY